MPGTGGEHAKYSCFCGLSQDEKRRKWFAGRCPMCHTKTKYPLRQQGSFDTATAEPGGGGGGGSYGGGGGRLAGKARSRSEERLHGCRLTDVPPPLYSHRPPRRDASTEWLDPASLSTSPPPPYATARNTPQPPLPAYQDLGGDGPPSMAAQPTDEAAAAMAATSMDAAANCDTCPSCNDLAAEMEQREYERRLMEQYSDGNGRVCTCAKCQERFHELYRQMNDDSALPMATPMLMQDVLSDGLAFCAIQ